jgi:hypothetical protein
MDRRISLSGCADRRAQAVGLSLKECRVVRDVQKSILNKRSYHLMNHGTKQSEEDHNSESNFDGIDDA